MRLRRSNGCENGLRIVCRFVRKLQRNYLCCLGRLSEQTRLYRRSRLGCTLRTLVRGLCIRLLCELSERTPLCIFTVAGCTLRQMAGYRPGFFQSKGTSDVFR